MIRRTLLSLSLAAALVVPASVWAAAASYKLDPVHSGVGFAIKHLGVSKTYGNFREIDGTIAFDPADPKATAFDITIKAASIDTGNAKRDEHLRGPDFFNVKQFPAITFKSTKVENGSTRLKVTGDLTLHGVKKEIVVEMELIGHRELGPMLGTRVGFETKFTIKRSDYGMNYGIENGALGDDVEIAVSFEAVKG